MVSLQGTTRLVEVIAPDAPVEGIRSTWLQVHAEKQVWHTVRESSQETQEEGGTEEL